MLSRILSRATLRAPVRSYTTSGHGSNRSWLQLWAKTGEEGAELWLLTVYMTLAGSMMIYQTCYATTFKKTEITTLPYLNKDYNQAGNRADWNNPTDQHTFTHVSDNFWAQQAWKDEVKALIAEIHAE